MRVLLTGALGNVGSHTVRELLAAGHRVRCLDLPSKANLARARRFGAEVELLWGDITDERVVARAVEGTEHVLHLAAVIPPHTDVDQTRAYRVNVGGLRRLLAAMGAHAPRAAMTFCSTAAVYGKNLEAQGPRTESEALHPEDAYGLQKVECEAMLRASGVPWSVFRLGVTPPVSGARFDPFVFAFHPRTRVEFTHPEDVALALARSVGNSKVLGRTLLVAGGAHNRYLYRDWLNLALERVGVGRLPLEAFGDRAYYTDWMDTSESQALLGYQRRNYAHYLDEIERGLGLQRHLVRVLRPLVQAHVLSQSPYYRANLQKPLWSEVVTPERAPMHDGGKAARETAHETHHEATA